MAGSRPVAADAGDHIGRRDAGVALKSRPIVTDVDSDRPSNLAGDRTLRLAALICAVLLALAALWITRSVMTPVAFALFIIALVWPLQRRLKTRLPQLVAILLTAAVALFAIGIGCWLIVWGFGRIAQWVIANSGRLQNLYAHLADLLEQRGLYAAELIAEQFNMAWIVGVVRGIGGSLQGIMSFALVTFIFVILGLLELEPLGRRLGRIGDGSFGVAAIDVAAEIGGRLQTYMLVRFGMSVLTGLGFWAFTAICGLDLSREWGVIAFVLNFIPFIGSFIATLLPTLFAAAQYESFSSAVWVFSGLNVVQFVVGSYIEPRVAGAAVSVSPFMVLFAVFFWAMLWGIAGAFIGVPILIALASLCARNPATRGIAIALSADAAPADRAP
jgi:AI-2 transport protein TqsA